MIAKLNKNSVTVNCTGCNSFNKEQKKYGGTCKKAGGLVVTRYRQAGVPSWCPKGIGS